MGPPRPPSPELSGRRLCPCVVGLAGPAARPRELAVPAQGQAVGLLVVAMLAGLAWMPMRQSVLNRDPFETRRFQFRSSPPPGATLEGGYYGFQTGRGLAPAEVIPKQPIVV